jgi:hypothetical protein
MLSAFLHLEDLAAISQVVLAAIAALALIGAIVQVLLTRSTTRQTLTYNYSNRFADPALIPFRKKTNELFALADTTQDEKWDMYKKWPLEDRIAALVLPNLIEELAGMYNNCLLNRKITKEFFGYTANDLWSHGWWFIDRSRRTYDGYYSQWEEMLKDMGFTLPDA